MQKIKYRIIEKLNTVNATSGEINLIVLLSKYQNEKGLVSGVYYKEVCEKLKISYQLFYDLLRSLARKQLISYEKASYYDYDVRILENDFSDGSFSEGYLNTNHKIFSNPKFFSLKAKEKILALSLLKILLTKEYMRDKQKSFIIGKEKLAERAALLGVSMRTIKGYFCSLKEFFSIGFKDGMYYITGKKEVYERSQQTEEEQYNEFRIRGICRREKVKSDNSKVTELAKSINRKKEKCLGNLSEEEQEKTLTELLTQALKKSVDKLKGEARCLNPAYVHSILNRLIEYKNSQEPAM